MPFARLTGSGWLLPRLIVLSQSLLRLYSLPSTEAGLRAMVRYTGVLAAAGLCLMSLPQTTGHAWYMIDEEHCGLPMVSRNMLLI